MKLNNKIYDLLKWFLVLVVPATILLLETLTSAWKWDIPIDAIVTTITAVATFLGSIVGISTASYYKSKNKEVE